MAASRLGWAALLLRVPSVSSQACAPMRVVYAPGTDLIGPSMQPDNQYGLEDGVVIRASLGFRMITAEMYGEPRWVRMRLGVWRSRDGEAWSRERTLRRSSARTDGGDAFAATWGPLFLWDAASARWALSYVSYRSGGHNFSGWTTNWDGRVRFRYAGVPHDAGLDSDFGDSGKWQEEDQTLLEPDTLGEPWPPCQGLQGTDSMYPYQLANGSWAAIVGTSHQESSWKPRRQGEGKWPVSLATAPKLAGPWTRYNPDGPPRDTPCLNLSNGHTENPIVSRLPHKGFMAIYDDLAHEFEGFGYSCSPDGVNWCRGAVLSVPGGCRTPFGLIELSAEELLRFASRVDQFGITTMDAIRAANSSLHWLFYTQTVGGWERFRFVLVERPRFELNDTAPC
ncbi:hypothetical protein AB1Y20_000218 [Prymnesium parvum]|uniref:Phospholipase B-like n=1 Tax=Prymnesium parvum TaxID=97485 RepID=A0AB34K5R5_PRYPA